MQNRDNSQVEPKWINDDPRLPDPTTVEPTTRKPTLCPTGKKFRADFSSPVPNRGNFQRVRGKLKGKYRNDGVAKLKLDINFGNYRFNKANIKEGDLIDWSVNTL